MVEPRFRTVQHIPAAAVFPPQYLHAARLGHPQRPVAVTMDTAVVTDATAVAKGVVTCRKPGDLPVGEVHSTAAFELHTVVIQLTLIAEL